MSWLEAVLCDLEIYFFYLTKIKKFLKIHLQQTHARNELYLFRYVL